MFVLQNLWIFWFILSFFFIILSLQADESEQYKVSEFLQDISDCEARRIFIIADQSFSGRLVEALESANSTPQYDNVVVFTSGGSMDYSWDSELTSQWVNSNQTTQCVDDVFMVRPSIFLPISSTSKCKFRALNRHGLLLICISKKAFLFISSAPSREGLIGYPSLRSLNKIHIHNAACLAIYTILANIVSFGQWNIEFNVFLILSM